MKLAPYAKYKPSGIGWLGGVPEHWEVDRIKWSTEGTTNGIWGDEPDGANDLICIRVADFDRERFLVVDEPMTLRAVDKAQRKRRLLHKGDLLIEKSGGGEKQLVGCVVLFDQEFKAVCSNFVARMPIARGHVPRYWSYVHAALYAGRLNYPAVKQTTGIQNLDSAAYLEARVCYPPQEEQHAIADFLDRETAKINALVTKKRTLIERLKEKRTALISRTVTRGIDPHTKVRPSGIDWLGDVPEHWEIKQLKWAVTFQRGHDLPAEQREVGSVPLVTSSGVSATHSCAKASGPGIVTGRYGTIGEFYLITEDYWPLNTTLYSIDLHGNEPRFLHVLLQHLSPLFLLHAVKSAVPGVDRNDIHSIAATVPPFVEQEAIVNFLNGETARLDSIVAKTETAIERLQEYRTALITAAVTGKIDVRKTAA